MNLKRKTPFLRIDKDLHELRALTLTMAGFIEESIEHSMRALLMRDKSRLKSVWSLEVQINNLHKKIDLTCFKTLACQSPMASDLRLVLAIIKINVDLERMGDLSYNNGFAIQSYLLQPPSMITQKIKEMSSVVVRMVRDCFDSFMERDLQLARQVLALDDGVDDYRDRLKQQLADLLGQPGAEVEMCMSLMSVVRNLERLADHATNIAEEIIFYITGTDIRHESDDKGELC